MKEIIIQIIKNNCYDVVGDDEIINSNNIYDDYAIDSLSFINIIWRLRVNLVSVFLMNI